MWIECAIFETKSSKNNCEIPYKKYLECKDEEDYSFVFCEEKFYLFGAGKLWMLDMRKKNIIFPYS